MCALLPCILGSNVLTDLLCIRFSAFGVNKDFVKFGDNKNKLFEKRPHFDNDEILPSKFLLVKALHLRNDIEIFESADGIEFELADLDGVEDSVVEVKNEDSFFGL